MIAQQSIPQGFPGTVRAKETDNTWQSEEAFRLLVESVKDYAIFMIDPAGFIVSWNKGAENIKGYKASEIIGKHIAVFYTKEDIEQNIPALNLKKAAVNGSYEIESLRVRKDGSLFWANIVFTALYNECGNIKGFAKVTRDITERKNGENKSAYLTQLIEKTPDAVFSYNASFNLLTWNKAAEMMYGYKAEEVLHKNTVEVLRAQLDEETRDQIREHIVYHRNWAGEVTHVRKDGSLVPVYLTATATNDVIDNSALYVCICRDLTEKKKAEKEAQKMRAEIDRLMQEKLAISLKEVSDYKYALDKSSIVAITDQKGIIKYVNENFCNISKYSQDELIGQDHRVINSGYHPKEFVRNLWVTIANGKVWKGELKNKAKDGKYYWVDTTIVPFLDAKGKPYQYVAIRADITERKKAEEDLHQLNEQLEEHVKTRTRQYEVANKELEAFSYSVSHDLRTPLRGVNGFAKILQEDYGQLLDEEGNRVLNKIISSAGTMGRLIDDLLNFSRTGRKEIMGSTINMKMLVESCLQELLPDAENPNYTLDIKALPDCNADISLMKQVWLNLLGNAIKYSSKNESPVITVGCNEDDFMRVYFVKDNGVGFDVQYSNKLFEVFQRLHSNEEFRGTGVGLALVKRIVEKHNGHVWADAALGKGATFYFSLPKKVLS